MRREAEGEINERRYKHLVVLTLILFLAMRALCFLPVCLGCFYRKSICHVICQSHGTTLLPKKAGVHADINYQILLNLPFFRQSCTISPSVPFPHQALSQGHPDHLSL